MKQHLESQRASALAASLDLRSGRPLCDEAHRVSYRSVAENAIAMFAAMGVPSVEVSVDDLPLLLEDCNQMIIAEADELVLWVLDMRLGLIHKSLRRERDDEITKSLQDPQSAREACWLPNARDKLYGGNVVNKVSELPWSVRVTEWDILPARAVHKDGNAIYSKASGVSCR
ncbi:hypothetical protein GGD65_007834 [Bradyrhizobium sp. CIR18]|uniref:hypothetical protein n=1 Tax=Bradyrhizobium sp. CIR18 TaxID=2663839 RepID=UPI0016064A12|nr:hypothetical protein [Bradyrhizobium sp. CIR18]MBB4366760.1 hypothetical protein [Bradyrhizobium sp. CIR18]